MSAARRHLTLHYVSGPHLELQYGHGQGKLCLVTPWSKWDLNLAGERTK